MSVQLPPANWATVQAVFLTPIESVNDLASRIRTISPTLRSYSLHGLKQCLKKSTRRSATDVPSAATSDVDPDPIGHLLAALQLPSSSPGGRDGDANDVGGVGTAPDSAAFNPRPAEHAPSTVDPFAQPLPTLDTFLRGTLPSIVDAMLKLGSLFPAPLPILQQNVAGVVTLSAAQAHTLLASMFLCVLPLPDTAELPPCNNFASLLSKKAPQEAAKIKMFLHYFERARHAPVTGKLVVRRACLPADVATAQFWSESTSPMLPLEVADTGTIEECHGFVQVDFANRYIGGGVLCGGCVQEEIRFAICPLLTVSLVFCESMLPLESLRLTGAEQFSQYDGYGFGFRFGGAFQDPTPRNDDGSVLTCLTAIDAIPFYPGSDQFSVKHRTRDLGKALAGFVAPPGSSECSPKVYPNIATGNWGCGAFGGIKELKSLLQWMAASQAGHRLRYMSFGKGKETGFSEYLRQISEQASRGLTVGDVWAILEDYCDSFNRASRPPLQPFVLEQVKVLVSSRTVPHSA
eukprot:m.51101 g.51101  ORF g.51101 m.51101 type:complete len:519 (+) comp12198_c1_seq3:46-1602(+)